MLLLSVSASRPPIPAQDFKFPPLLGSALLEESFKAWTLSVLGEWSILVLIFIISAGPSPAKSLFTELGSSWLFSLDFSRDIGSVLVWLDFASCPFVSIMWRVSSITSSRVSSECFWICNNIVYSNKYQRSPLNRTSSRYGILQYISDIVLREFFFFIDSKKIPVPPPPPL